LIALHVTGELTQRIAIVARRATTNQIFHRHAKDRLKFEKENVLLLVDESKHKCNAMQVQK
jgi:hypothetical protein